MKKTTSNFVSEVQKLLECPLCFETLLNPVQLPCLHSFCENCIKCHISVQHSISVKCPVCMSPNRADNPLVRDFFKQNLIDMSQTTVTCKKHNELIVRFCTVCERLMCVDCVADKCQNGQYGHQLINKDVIENNICTFLQKSQFQVSQWKTNFENTSASANTFFEEAAKTIKTLINSHADDVCSVVKQEANKMCKQVDAQCAARKRRAQHMNDEALKSVETLEKAIASGLQSPLEDRVDISSQLKKKMKLPNIVEIDPKSCSLDIEFIPMKWNECELSIGKLQGSMDETELAELQESIATPNLVVRVPTYISIIK